MKLIALVLALAVTIACGAKSPSSPEPEAPLVTEATHYMALANIPGDFATGSIVATIDLPVALLASSTGALPKSVTSIPVIGATLTLKNGNVLPLVGSVEIATLKASLTTSNGLYKLTINLKDKRNPDGTFQTADGKVGGIVISITPAPASPKMWCGFFNGDEKGWIKIQTNLDGNGTGDLNGSFDDGSGIVTFTGKATNNKVTFHVKFQDGTGDGTGDIMAGQTMSGFWSNSFKQKGQWNAQTHGCS